jgi:hypothetical protein
LSNPSPEKILDDIKTWTTEKNKLVVRPREDPNAHFSVLVSLPIPHRIIAITVAYPKAGDKIIMGWIWIPEESDRKAYAAFKDRKRKESVRTALEEECRARGLTIGTEPANVDRLERLAISKFISISDFTRENYKTALWNLMEMWWFLMSKFEEYDMSRASFDPSEYI